MALVIGNGAYVHATALPNPLNDATDMAAALQRLGFRVTTVTNATSDIMRRQLRDFARAASGAELAMVYFAGHGLEIGGENYLIPVDAEMRSDRDVEHEAIGLRSVMNTVSGARRLGLVVLDACRNDPFRPRMIQSAGLTRTVSRGLGRVEPTGNLLVAFAAREGTVADDGRGRNSPFTAALLRHVATPGLEVADLFREIRADVTDATGGLQEPVVYGSLGRERIFLAGTAASIAALPPPAQRPAAPDRSMVALRAAGWEVVPRAGHGEGAGFGDWVIMSVAFSRDRRTLATGGGDRTARLWDVATGRELRRFEEHSGAVSSVAFGPDGRTVLTGSHDSTARLWDAATGRELRRFEGHNVVVLAVAFAPDGQTVLTGSFDGTARLWNAATGRVFRIMLALPDSWAVLDEDRKVVDIGPNAWRYLYELDEAPGRLPRVIAPACEDDALRSTHPVS